MLDRELRRQADHTARNRWGILTILRQMFVLKRFCQCNCDMCPKPGQSDTLIFILGIYGINIDVSSIFLTYITCAKPAMLHIRDSLFRYRQLFQTRKSPNLNLLLNSRVHDAPLLLLSEIFGVCRPLELWPEHVLRHYLLDWQLRRRPVRKRRH